MLLATYAIIVLSAVAVTAPVAAWFLTPRFAPSLSVRFTLTILGLLVAFFPAGILILFGACVFGRACI